MLNVRTGGVRSAPVIALLIALSIACDPLAPRNPIRLNPAPPSLPPGPFSHAQLAWALAAGTDEGSRPEASRRFRSYLATIATVGPRSRPDLFPGSEDALAYLVNAHLAWATELDAAPQLSGVGADLRRRVRFPLDGAPTSLASLEREIRRRAPHDPRLGLWLDTGVQGRPPRPLAPLEAHAFGFLVDLQARRCGAEPGTWGFDAAGRRLAVASWATGLAGLPDDPVRRARRLLDVVPPPAGLRQQILEACGNGLQNCRITTARAPGRG